MKYWINIQVYSYIYVGIFRYLQGAVWTYISHLLGMQHSCLYSASKHMVHALAIFTSITFFTTYIKQSLRCFFLVIYSCFQLACNIETWTTYNVIFLDFQSPPLHLVLEIFRPNILTYWHFGPRMFRLARRRIVQSRGCAGRCVHILVIVCFYKMS
jgi:hypothetical protein